MLVLRPLKRSNRSKLTGTSPEALPFLHCAHCSFLISSTNTFSFLDTDNSRSFRALKSKTAVAVEFRRLELTDWSEDVDGTMFFAEVLRLEPVLDLLNRVSYFILKQFEPSHVQNYFAALPTVPLSNSSVSCWRSAPHLQKTSPMAGPRFRI